MPYNLQRDLPVLPGLRLFLFDEQGRWRIENMFSNPETRILNPLVVWKGEAAKNCYYLCVPDQELQAFIVENPPLADDPFIQQITRYRANRTPHIAGTRLHHEPDFYYLYVLRQEGFVTEYYLDIFQSDMNQLYYADLDVRLDFSLSEEDEAAWNASFYPVPFFGGPPPRRLQVPRVARDVAVEPAVEPVAAPAVEPIAVSVVRADIATQTPEMSTTSQEEFNKLMQQYRDLKIFCETAIKEQTRFNEGQTRFNEEQNYVNKRQEYTQAELGRFKKRQKLVNKKQRRLNSKTTELGKGVIRQTRELKTTQQRMLLVGIKAQSFFRNKLKKMQNALQAVK